MLYEAPVRGKIEVGSYQVWVGQRFGRWTIIELPVSETKRLSWHTFTRCQCDCGFVRTFLIGRLLSGRTKQCMSCYRQRRGTHRLTPRGQRQRPRLYRIWQGMLRRCNPSNQATKAVYHGRGITVCEQWRDDFLTFRDWALANGYAPNLTLDRFPNTNGNYEPGNCRWATTRQQARNKRTNHILTAFGESKPICEWADDPRCRATLACLYLRTYAGWEPERAITIASRQQISQGGC
jgi:hypothetical protein